MEMTILTIISQSGDARSSCMEAIQHAKNGDFENAERFMKEAAIKLESAHKEQTKLIQAEAGGCKTELTLLLIHAQDHLMNAGTVKDMAREFIDLYRNIMED